MKCLIVDDDIISRKILLNLVSNIGSSDFATNGHEVITSFNKAIAKNELYDLILLDVVMPLMDGHTALQLIRATEKKMDIPKEKRVKIIMTTGLDDQENVLDAFKLGCDGYILKPVNKMKFFKELIKLELIDEKSLAEKLS